MSVAHQRFSASKLYGRDSHVKELTDICRRTRSVSSPEVVLVIGCSGSGKTSLVRAVTTPLLGDGFTFISGKFDQLQHAQPLTAIISAFDRYFDEVSGSGAECIDVTKNAILEATGDCCGVLTDFFPSLGQIVGSHCVIPAQIGPKEAQHRFEYVFRLMVRTIAELSKPVVFFLDDLQWADAYSLHLITTLVTDKAIQNLTFIGCFRDDEVDNTHPLGITLYEIRTRSVAITKIKVNNIIKEDINALISDTFHLSDSFTTSLTDIVHQKTNGNIFCILQFLQSLCDGGLLQWSSVSNSWEFKNSSIEAEFFPHDKVRILVRRILHLPEKTQYALELMSCVGASCLESTLMLFLDENIAINVKKKEMTNIDDKPSQIRKQRNDLLLFFKFAVHEGLIKEEGANYRFSHDHIQFAAYSLIPEDEKILWHLQIGQNVWENASEREKDKVIFIAVDQMNYALGLLESDGQKENLAKLNLRAGEKAMSLSTFSSSALYFDSGIQILGKHQWENNYELSLHLHNYYAEAEYCNGNFSAVGQAAGVILSKAESPSHKVRAYFILIKALCAQNRLDEALNIGIKVLTQLGKQPPSEFSDVPAIYANFNKTASIFKDTTDFFLNFKIMEDSDALIAMNFLGELLLPTYFLNQDIGLWLVDHMLQLSFVHGVNKDSACALAGFSAMLFGLGDLDGSKNVGRMALRLQDELDTQESLPRVCFIVYSGMLSRTEPLKEVSEKFLHAYKVGMQTGDIQIALFNARLYCAMSFCSGGGLDELGRDIQIFEKQMIEYKQELNLKISFPLKHAVLTLMTCSDNPSHESNELFKESKNLLQGTFLKKRSYASNYRFYCICIAYIFCDYDFAREMIELRWILEENLCRLYDSFGAGHFYDCLSSVALARKTNEDKWKKYALDYFEMTKSFALNCQHRILLLETEIDILMGNTDNAIMKYNKAINAAAECRFIHEQAIANERAGDFCLSKGDVRASYYYGEAYILYFQWGARGKAAHLKKKHSLEVNGS